MFVDGVLRRERQAQSRNKIRIATGGPSLSYFPIYAAVQKGFFARRGFDVEMIQMNATLTAAALLNRAVDYTIIPSAIATAAARVRRRVESIYSKRSEEPKKPLANASRRSYSL
jgi:ABC-type nitrate/sulfonate/bicarbonate transport system substrate-binding protein